MMNKGSRVKSTVFKYFTVTEDHRFYVCTCQANKGINTDQEVLVCGAKISKSSSNNKANVSRAFNLRRHISRNHPEVLKHIEEEEKAAKLNIASTSSTLELMDKKHSPVLKVKQSVPTPLTIGKPDHCKLQHGNHQMLMLESLAQDESFMDVTLTSQGRAIKAHKSVLSAMSFYFRRVLGENPCQHPIIIMPRDILFDELRNLITYIYKGEISLPFGELGSLLKTAQALEIKGLNENEELSDQPSENQGVCLRDSVFTLGREGTDLRGQSSVEKMQENFDMNTLLIKEEMLEEPSSQMEGYLASPDPEASEPSPKRFCSPSPASSPTIKEEAITGCNLYDSLSDHHLKPKQPTCSFCLLPFLSLERLRLHMKSEHQVCDFGVPFLQSSLVNDHKTLDCTSRISESSN